MTEYIEREKVLSKAAPVAGCFSNMISAYDVIMLPAADVAPVRHGYWIDNGANGYKWAFICSRCGYVDGHPSDDRYNFCPSCGARMDGGSENG